MVHYISNLMLSPRSAADRLQSYRIQPVELGQQTWWAARCNDIPGESAGRPFKIIISQRTALSYLE